MREVLLLCYVGLRCGATHEFALSSHTGFSTLLLREEVDDNTPLVKATIEAHVVWTVL